MASRKKKTNNQSSNKRAQRVKFITTIGHLAFLAGIIITLVAGLLVEYLNLTILNMTLVILGLIVGLLNVTQDETTEFLVASIFLMLTSFITYNYLPSPISGYLQGMFGALPFFVGPAALLVSLKAYWGLATRR